MVLNSSFIKKCEYKLKYLVKLKKRRFIYLVTMKAIYRQTAGCQESGGIRDRG